MNFDNGENMVELAREDILEYVHSGRLVIRPFSEDSVKECSVDLRLGNKFEIDVTDDEPVIDLMQDVKDRQVRPLERKDGEAFILYPQELVRAMTKEYVRIPNDLVGHLGGRSSLARFGIMVEIAPRIDPGFEGNITLELANHGKRAIMVYPGLRFCSLELMRLSRRTEPYKGKYRGIKSPASSRLASELRGRTQRARKRRAA